MKIFNEQGGMGGKTEKEKMATRKRTIIKKQGKSKVGGQQRLEEKNAKKKKGGNQEKKGLGFKRTKK